MARSFHPCHNHFEENLCSFFCKTVRWNRTVRDWKIPPAGARSVVNVPVARLQPKRGASCACDLGRRLSAQRTKGGGVRKPQQGAGGHKFIFDRRCETCSWQVLIPERTGKKRICVAHDVIWEGGFLTPTKLHHDCGSLVAKLICSCGKGGKRARKGLSHLLQAKLYYEKEPCKNENHSIKCF